MDLARWPLPALIALALIAFAANSILARGALGPAHIDAASFTSLRLASGAATLWAIQALRGDAPRRAEVDWRAALGLFAYAALFSFAYLRIDAGLGALILFGSVQATMIGAGLWMGERTTWLGALGAAVAVAGVAALLAPGEGAADPLGMGLMVVSGVSWGVYSLLGRGAADPVRATTLNFIAAAPLALLLSLLALGAAAETRMDATGALLAVASGALASGCGYVIWYAALARLTATRAAILQLGTPVLAAIAGVLLLAEPATWRLVLCSIAVLGGVGLYLTQRQTGAPQADGERP